MSRRPLPRAARPPGRKPPNKLIFGLPLASDVKAEITEFWLVALNNRPFISRKGMNLSAAHNDMVRQALELPKHVLSWKALVWLEHDHTFDFPTVFDYMERLDLERYPVTGLLYVERMPPNDPVGYDRNEEGGYVRFSEERMAEFGSKPGLYQVTGGVGMGCTIIARSVLEAMAKLNPEKPWYYAPAEVSGEMTDDIWFCQQAVAAGFPVHVETRFRIGHWGTCNYGVEHYWAGRQAGRRVKTDVLVEELIARRHTEPVSAGAEADSTSAPPEAAYTVRDKRAVRV